ncbi:hypothetical protein Tco_0201127 [Tanacetum coccineum]
MALRVPTRYPSVKRLIKVSLLYVATTSNTLDPSILTSDITLSRSKWRTGWLSCICHNNSVSDGASIFTKPLARARLNFSSNKLGMRMSDFATPMIKSTVIESLEDAVLAKSSSQPQSTYKATTSLTEISSVDHLKLDHKIAQAEKPPISFDKLMSTPIDFSAYVINHLKIDNLTQDYLVGPVFNLLKGTCRSHVELEYNIEECYKVVTDRLDWNNPEGKKYLFDLSKPLPLIMDRGHQVVPVDYFINNDLEYLRGGSSSRKYTTSTTKTKAGKYDIQGTEDTVFLR